MQRERDYITANINTVHVLCFTRMTHNMQHSCQTPCSEGMQIHPWSPPLPSSPTPFYSASPVSSPKFFKNRGHISFIPQSKGQPPKPWLALLQCPCGGTCPLHLKLLLFHNSSYIYISQNLFQFWNFSIHLCFLIAYLERTRNGSRSQECLVASCVVEKTTGILLGDVSPPHTGDSLGCLPSPMFCP